MPSLFIAPLSHPKAAAADKRLGEAMDRCAEAARQAARRHHEEEEALGSALREAKGLVELGEGFRRDMHETLVNHKASLEGRE